MPKICYDEHVLDRLSKNDVKLAVIGRANAIIETYRAQGFDLTLRQMYYQFVSRGWIPNKDTEYKRLGDIIQDGRLAGLIDWEAIVDRTRFLRSLPHWKNPADIVQSCAAQFSVDRWAGQEMRVEVWIEKDALVGVIEPICNEYDVPFFSCRGYTSASELWVAAQRIRTRAKSNSAHTIVLHFGDHDPSGIDMTRDIDDRLTLFRADVEVRRLALNMDQVEQYGPPPNPAKLTDSRCAGYIQRFGDESWELDALEPAAIAALIEEEINGMIDPDIWAEQTEAQLSGRKQLKSISNHWSRVLKAIDE